MADNFYRYLMNNPAGSKVGVWSPSQQSNTNSSLRAGDVVFYDWNNDGIMDHAGIIVGSGTDPDSKYVGTLQDQHTTNRYHAIWHLKPYNPNWATTIITVVRPF